MAIGHLQTIWEDREDVPATSVLRDVDGVWWYRFEKSANGPKTIVEHAFSRDPFVVSELFRYILPFQAIGGFRRFRVIPEGFCDARSLWQWNFQLRWVKIRRLSGPPPRPPRPLCPLTKKSLGPSA